MDGTVVPLRTRRRAEKRISNACRRCRASKIRCDDKQPICVRCKTKNLECIRDQEWQPNREPARGLTFEGRLSRVEALLQNSTTAPTGQPAPAAAHTTSSTTISPALSSTLSAPDQSMVPIHGSPIPGSAYAPQTNPSSSQGGSTLRRPWRTMDEIPVLRLTEDRVARLKEAISDDPSWQRVFIPMFSKPEVLLLVEAYLDDVNPIISLFERRSLLALCQDQFPVDNDTWDPAWWACLNAVVGIAIQMKTLSSAFEAVGRISWSFFKNAFAVFPQLMQTTPTLMSTKALLCMSMFLSGTTDNKTMMLLLSSAAKHAQMLRASGPSQEPAVIEDKKRTLSVAYLLEEACCANCGFRLAPANSIPDTDLPQIDPMMRQQGDATAETWTFFEPRVELAVIESKAQKYLQKAKSPDEILENRILILGQELEAWRQRLPTSIRPQYSPLPGSEPSGLGIVMLHCAFYRSTDAINRAYHLCKLHQSSTTSQSLASQLESHGPLDSPRALIRLFRHMGEIGYTDLWRLLPFLLCSAITIYVHIIQNPHKGTTTSDLVLIRALLRFIQTMQNQGCDLDRFLAVCTELERSASTAVTAFYASGTAAMTDTTNDPKMMHHSWLLANPDYMPLVQGLMGNIPSLRAQSSNVLSSMLGGLTKDSDGFISVKPASLHPSTYGFNN
ncbi:hypothetical protein FDECE_6688 [Fusarium decemcellulare]|nr:hypothetical protein FDECE_6688 [Fusarium decemcellulare]